MFRPSRTNLIMLLAAALSSAACGIGTTVSNPLPDVDAEDDEAVTFMNTPVNILVLANDMQDDDLLTDIGIAVDQAMNQQISAAEIDFLTFPEQATYTPPTDFVGTATFTYDITGLGTQFDYTSTDTATVTVTVTDVRPPVMAMDDMATTDLDQPVTIDVLQNDMQDADMIDLFDMDAFPISGGVQLGAVTSVNDQLTYTPPLGFEGTVTFSYIISGAGIAFELNSVDSASVTVDVVAPPASAVVQFEDASMEIFEVLLFFVGQDAIDLDDPTAALFGFSEVTTCFEVSPGTNVALQAQILFDQTTVVDGICPELAAGMEYTIRVQPDSPLEVVCVEGLADPSFCN